MSNTYSSSPASLDDDDAEFRRFEKIFDDAKTKLVHALRENKLEAANSSSEQLKSTRRQLLETEIKISKLNQENSQLREEKRRSDLSLKLAEDNSSDLARKFQEEKKRREEIESALQDKTSVIQSLRLQLYEKESEILRLTTGNQYPNYQADGSTHETSSSSRQTATSSSSASSGLNQHQYQLQHQQLESEEAVSTSNPEPSRAYVKVKSISMLTESPPSSLYNPECPTDLEENQTSHEHWNSPVSHSPHTHTYIKTEPGLSNDDRLACAPPQRINRERIAHQPKQQQPHSSPSSSSSGGRFEMSVKRSSRSSRSSPYDEKNRAMKRSRRGSGQSSESGASESSRSSISKHSSFDSPAEGSNRISVLEIPERLRLNYSFNNNWDLDQCPHAREFWYDQSPSNVNSIKYFIRFYDDDPQQCADPSNTKRFCIKEQIQLQEPTIRNLKLKEITRRLETHLSGSEGDCRMIRLWIDVRDFDVFCPKIYGFFNQFGQFISHFTYGRRLYSSVEVRPALILSFIFKAMHNLEYFGIIDGMLTSMDHDVKDLPVKPLHKLRVIRLMSITSRFSIPFITELLIRAPSLTHFYGMPLHCLSELELYFETSGKKDIPPWIFPTNINTNTNTNMNMNVDSDSSDCYISMNCVKSVYRPRLHIYEQQQYQHQAQQEFKKYVMDLTTLIRLHPPLEVVDARTFFIRCAETRRLSQRKLAELIHLNAHSIQILTLEPVEIQIQQQKQTQENTQNTNEFPRLELCHTLHFDMNSYLDPDSGLGYFSSTNSNSNFDWSYCFPSLREIQISLDEKGRQGLGKHEGKAQQLFDCHFPHDIFRPCDALRRIEKLSLIEFAPVSLIGKFHGLFQRITILSLKLSLIEMSKVLPRVFKFWPGLQQLILDIGFSSHMDFSLDSAFTGIHFKQCRTLNERLNQMKLKPGEKLDVGIIQKEIDKSRREFDSISNLKELSVLKMVLNHKGKVELQPSECLFTPVSAIYGFGRERMPNLRTVVVGFDDRMTSFDKRCMMKILKPMKPYLTIDY